MNDQPETSQAKIDPELSKEAGKFLERDFNQCFTQMRHYDAQLWEICKFAFAAYSAVLTLAVGLFQYSHDKQVNLVPAALALLSVGALLGFFLFGLTIRNRVYFVFVTRYLNEHRRLFLSAKPYGFLNETGMYTNPTQPPFFNWRSSQSWLSYLVAALNAVLVSAATGMSMYERPGVFTWFGVVFISVFVMQIAFGIDYLLNRENKTASKAVFGKE